MLNIGPVGLSYIDFIICNYIPFVPNLLRVFFCEIMLNLCEDHKEKLKKIIPFTTSIKKNKVLKNKLKQGSRRLDY